MYSVLFLKVVKVHLLTAPFKGRSSVNSIIYKLKLYLIVQGHVILCILSTKTWLCLKHHHRLVKLLLMFQTQEKECQVHEVHERPLCVGKQVYRQEKAIC